MATEVTVKGLDSAILRDRIRQDAESAHAGDVWWFQCTYPGARPFVGFVYRTPKGTPFVCARDTGRTVGKPEDLIKVQLLYRPGDGCKHCLP